MKLPVKGEKSYAEDILALDIDAAHLPEPKRQFQFAAPERKWSADFAWPEYRLIVEVDGAVWTSGRHTRGSGRVKDMERDNWCTLHGWRILRYTTQQVEDGEAWKGIKEFIEMTGAKW